MQYLHVYVHEQTLSLTTHIRMYTHCHSCAFVFVLEVEENRILAEQALLLVGNLVKDYIIKDHSVAEVGVPHTVHASTTSCQQWWVVECHDVVCYACVQIVLASSTILYVEHTAYKRV